MYASSVRIFFRSPIHTPAIRYLSLLVLTLAGSFPTCARADEHLFGWVLGAETLPAKQAEAYEFLTLRTGKAEGTYLGRDSETEMEYGLTDQFQASLSFAPQVILQKNFLDDTLVFDVNGGTEFAWGKRPAEQYPRELAFTGGAGVSYRFASNWYFGVESHIRSEYPMFHLGNFEHVVMFAGPSLHHGTQLRLRRRRLH
jgi:hypothetical protein